MLSARLSPLVLAGLLWAGAAGADPFRLIITDMEPPLVPNSVVDIALAGGYFDRAGVEVELVRVQATPMALTALQAGEGEMANVATESLVSLVARGNTQLRAVMSPNKALPYLIAGAEGRRLEDLATGSFAIARIGSLDQTLSQKVLTAAGLDPAALRMVPLGQPTTRLQALAAGQVDATTVSIGTYLALPGHERLPVLVGVDDFYAAAPLVGKVNAVTTETLASRGAEVEAVIEALTLAARDMAAAPQTWAETMAPLRPDVAAETLSDLSAAYQGSWSVNGGLQAAELRLTSDWLYQGAEFQGLPPVEMSQWADFAPLDRVLAKIGAAPDGDPVSR